MSTTRTSLTESSTQEMDDSLVPLPRVTSRPRATYRLADFLIQRTLGTGSFGRVHLGQSSTRFTSFQYHLSSFHLRPLLRAHFLTTLSLSLRSAKQA